MKINADYEENLKMARSLRTLSAKLSNDVQGAYIAVEDYGLHHQDKHYHSMQIALTENYEQLLKLAAKVERYADHLERLAEPLIKYHDLKFY